MESASTGASELTRVIGELTRGREIADQLLSMLRDDASTGNMVEKILDSFTGSLSIVMGTTTAAYSDEASQVSTYMINNSPTQIIKTEEDSGESCKKPPPKDRRGCYKRRRTSETWTKETPTNYDQDGHAWRKYGQKVILGTKHPRNYYRCTHKYDQLCQATKYVQKIQNEPSLYRTTYHGRHTCKKLSESPNFNQLIMDAAATPNDSSVIWSFQSSNLGDQVKTEDHTQMLYHKSSLTHGENNYFISPTATPTYNNHELTPSSVHNNNHLSGFSSAGSDQGDVISSDGYSCTTSALYNTMDSLMDFEDFPDF